MEISQGKYVGMVLIGLQNTFDTVDHDILLEKKLDNMEFNHNKLLESYLKGRKQMVVAHNIVSELGIVSCGVPKGNILGPLLFLCYVNDMPISIKFKLLLYADDSSLMFQDLIQEKLVMSYQENYSHVGSGSLAINYLFIYGKQRQFYLDQKEN